MRLTSAVFLATACAFIVCVDTTVAGDDGKNPPVATAEQVQAIQAQIKLLNAADNLQRENAEAELSKIGPVALPLLKEAMKSPDAETAARAKRLVGKMTEGAVRPIESYAECMPANSIFFLEAPHTKQTLEKLKGSPMGKFWDLPAMQNFLKGHRAAQVPNDQKTYDAMRAIPSLLDGKALIALGSPDTAEAAELDPPMVYVLESKQAATLETQVRNLFEGMVDPAKTSRRYGPFTVEEHITAQTVYGQQSIIHSLTQKGIESFLDKMLKRPEKSLQPELRDTTALLPNFDFVYSLAADGLKDLADDALLIDDQQLSVVNALGFTPGSTWRGVVSVTPDGLEDAFQLKPAGGDKNEGLLAVLTRMAASVPPAPKAGDPQALDLIPWQTALLVSFQGDVSGNAAAISKALTTVDQNFAPAPAPDKAQQPAVQPKPGNVFRPNQPVKPPTAPGVPAPPEKAAPDAAPRAGPAPGGVPTPDPAVKKADGTPIPQPKATTLGQKALEAGGGGNPAAPAPAPGPAPAPAPAPADQPPAPKAAAAEKIAPHLTAFTKLGMKMEQFLGLVDGPVQLALFVQQIEEDAPESIPISPLVAVVLKDSKPVEQALEAGAAGVKPRFTKDLVNGGTHYIETDGNQETRPGFWLKGNYLAWSNDRDLIEMAGGALLHAKGNERIADRATYKQALASKRLDPQALMTIFGDAEQVMEMPYGLAKVNWQEDEQNPWPDYALIRPLLKDKPVILDFKSIPGGIQGHALTPLSLILMIEAFRRPFIEAGYW
ncbi:MAG TPA: hypothetical protein VGP72_22050 [Planctomycetota bacterium]|jgi:hypothetical protein